MIDRELVEHFIKSKVLLQEKLSSRMIIGQISGGAEIESQMMSVERRMMARIKQAVCHGIEEMNALHHILLNPTK